MLLIVTIFIITIFASGCTNNSNITINDETPIPYKECSNRGLSNRIIMLESTSCSHCELAKPKLQQLEKELNVNITYYDLSNNEDRKKVEALRITPKYTPTVLIGCNVLIGDKSKEVYKEAIENFLENE